jgi:hypothetical protein
MKHPLSLTALSFVGTLVLSWAPAQAQIVITEVDPAGSASSSGYAGDWFELTNYSSTAQNITGWQMIDSHTEGGSTAEVPLLGVSSINPGQSVVFLDYSAQTGTLAQQETEEQTAFDEAWFGTAAAPAGYVFGFYNGTNVGLSQTSDAVNILNASSVQVTGVDFGADSSSSPKPTFDNSVAKLGSTTQASDPTISTFSATGVGDAFESHSGVEIGSPDEVTNAPEPSTRVLFGLTGLIVLAWRRRGFLLGL